MVSHTFSLKSVGQFEVYMLNNIQLFVDQWDKLSRSANGGYARINALEWLNYLAFDIIGDLAFGAPFGMLEKGEDIAEAILPDGTTSKCSAIEVINRRGEVTGYVNKLNLAWTGLPLNYTPSPFSCYVLSHFLNTPLNFPLFRIEPLAVSHL